ncbi:MAG: stage II sporulation protein M [Trueperella sp.]|nr:stage II sporulation protein M [Trueperella sp.]
MESRAFAKVHQAQWERLQKLTRQRRLSGAEVDEFVRLYQEAASHLATLRTQAPDADLTLYLSAVVASARTRLTAARRTSWRRVAQFFVRTLPVAFYRVRWWTAATAGVFIAVFATVLLTYAANPQMITELGSLPTLEEYANSAFASYYTEHGHSDFAVLVWTNNAWIAVQMIGGGITGVYPAVVLLVNAVGVGQAGAVMNHFGGLGEFFALILPHGILELTAIFIAAAAGFRLFWVALVPGNLPRFSAVAAEGRQVVLVAVGLVGVLAVSGLLEGFVTPSVLPWWLKIVIGAAVWLAFWVWVVFFARRAGTTSADADPVGFTISYAA